MGVGLHWITACTDEPLEAVAELLPTLSECPGEPGGFGHPLRFMDERGVTVYAGSTRPGQPVVLVAPGEVCEAHALDVMQDVEGLDGWVTRLDVQRDVGPDDLAEERLRSMYQAAQRQELRGPFKSINWHETHGERPGRTLYLGSRKSRQMLRSYDERGPLRLEFEFHFKRDTGRAPVELLHQGLEPAAGVWAGALAAYEWPGVEWWSDLQGDPFAWDRPSDLASSFEDAVGEFRRQHGANLWAMLAAGVTLAELVRVPEVPTTEQRRRWETWLRSCGRENELGRHLAKGKRRAG